MSWNRLVVKLVLTAHFPWSHGVALLATMEPAIYRPRAAQGVSQGYCFVIKCCSVLRGRSYDMEICIGSSPKTIFYLIITYLDLDLDRNNKGQQSSGYSSPREFVFIDLSFMSIKARFRGRRRNSLWVTGFSTLFQEIASPAFHRQIFYQREVYGYTTTRLGLSGEVYQSSPLP